MCVLSIKVAIRKSLETYLMNLVYIYIYIYIYIYKGFMVFTSSLGELMEDQMLQYC